MAYLAARLIHELWWWISRWPHDERRDGRAAVHRHYHRP